MPGIKKGPRHLATAPGIHTVAGRLRQERTRRCSSVLRSGPFGMGTGRAQIGSVGTFHQATAVAAAPHDGGFTREHAAFLDVLGEREETLFVVLLRNGDVAHHTGDFGKTFRVGDIRKRGIHFSIFMMFTGSGGVQVGFRARDDAGREGGSDFHVAAFKELEQALGVFFFLKRGFSEDVGDLHKAVFFGRTGKIIIAVAGLRFTGKGGEDIPFSLRTSKISYNLSFW